MFRSEEIKVDEHAVSFLIAEFTALQERARHYEDLKSAKINYFLVLVAATLAGLFGFASSQATQISVRTLFVMGLAVSIPVFLVGVVTLSQSVGISIAIVSLYRKAGRIRRYFANLNSSIWKYLPYKANDDSPNIFVGTSSLTFRGGDAILVMVNSFTITNIILSVLQIIRLPFGLNILEMVFFPLGILVFVLGWYFQRMYVFRLLRNSEKWMKNDIRFPFRDDLVADK